MTKSKMPTIKIDINKITQEQIDLIVVYLKRGQVIAYPTDTIYGLGCDARDQLAVKKIKKIKGRDAQKREGEKAMLALVSDFEMLKQYCLVSEEQEGYLRAIWPGCASFNHITSPTPLYKGVAQKPVTVILESKRNLPAELTGGLNSLAVRLPKSEFLIKIIKQAGFPIVSTSLNKTGEPSLDNVQNLGKYFKHLPDLAVDAGTIAGEKPSRLVDIRDMGNVKVIRE